MVDNPNYGALDNMAIAGLVLLVILLLVRFGRGFVANISVLLGLIFGCIVAVLVGKMGFEKVGAATGSTWSPPSPSACRPSTS